MTDWIANPEYIPVGKIGDVLPYPTVLVVKGIHEVGEFNSLPMISCKYASDSPALLSPDFSATRVIAPYSNETYGAQFTIETEFKITEIFRSPALVAEHNQKHGYTIPESCYLYRLESTNEQLTKSAETQNYYLQYSTGYEDYSSHYAPFTPLEFIAVAQGIHDFIDARAGGA